MQEQWTRWEPVIGLARKYDIETIYNNNDGLTITLMDVKNNKSKVHMIFTGRLISYRWADETYMDYRVQNLFRDYGSEFFCEWTFFKVTDSEYSKYISKTSGTISDYTPYIHFAFFTEESIFEVLVMYEPEIEFVHLP